MNSELSIFSESGYLVPVYPSTPEKQGLYLALFHGRACLDTEMEDWGSNGPMIGPLEWCHTTYATEIYMQFLNLSDAHKYFRETPFGDCPRLKIANYVVEYAGVFYGDWTIYVTGRKACSARSRTRI